MLGSLLEDIKIRNVLEIVPGQQRSEVYGARDATLLFFVGKVVLRPNNWM